MMEIVTIVLLDSMSQKYSKLQSEQNYFQIPKTFMYRVVLFCDFALAEHPAIVEKQMGSVVIVNAIDWMVWRNIFLSSYEATQICG